MCRAIINSSLVGITHAETLLCGVEILWTTIRICFFVDLDSQPGG